MIIGIFQTHNFEKPFLEAACANYHFQVKFFTARLDQDSVAMAKNCDVICCFANDDLNKEVIKSLHDLGVKLIATRSAGFNHIDISAAKEFKIPVVRVPEYSPYAVAEHAVALMLSLNRKIPQAYLRVKELNFTLDGLVGFDLHGKTVGVIGVGRIGKTFAKIMNGFGAIVLGYDIQKDEDLERTGVLKFVELERLFKESDIISLHVPLNAQTKHLINQNTIQMMKSAVMIINTGRGGLIDTTALIEALKKKKIGSAGLDVYEEEEGVFFEDLSCLGIEDDKLARLLTFPNVLITSHQGFLTAEALSNIAQTTFQNIADFGAGRELVNKVI